MLTYGVGLEKGGKKGGSRRGEWKGLMGGWEERSELSLLSGNTAELGTETKHD